MTRNTSRSTSTETKHRLDRIFSAVQTLTWGRWLCLLATLTLFIAFGVSWYYGQATWGLGLAVMAFAALTWAANTALYRAKHLWLMTCPCPSCKRYRKLYSAVHSSKQKQ